jgi:hypothetical protein
VKTTQAESSPPCHCAVPRRFLMQQTTGSLECIRRQHHSVPVLVCYRNTLRLDGFYQLCIMKGLLCQQLEGTPTGRLLLALQEVFGGDAAVPWGSAGQRLCASFLACLFGSVGAIPTVGGLLLALYLAGVVRQMRVRPVRRFFASFLSCNCCLAVMPQFLEVSWPAGFC